MKLSKENFSKFLEGDKKNFIILFLVFFFVLIAIGYFYQKTIKEITRETPPLIQRRQIIQTPQIVSGTIERLDRENFALTLKTNESSLDITMNEETRIYLEPPKHIEDFAKFLPPKEGVKKLEVGKAVRVIFAPGGMPDLFLAQEIWKE